ncbi:MAG: 6-bladed beta-propeller [Longimicrobiales bacterium]
MNANIQNGARLLLATLILVPMNAGAQQKIQIPARDKILPEKPAQIYAVGAEDGEEWELLSGVRQVAFDAQDNLYVLDGNNYRILVFDANGRFLRKISKQGGGPGELMSPVGLVVTTDGSLVVADLGRRAFSVFKTDGTYVKNVAFPEGEMPGFSGAGSVMQAHPKHGVVARIGMMLMFGAGGPGAAGAIARGIANGPNPADRPGGPTGERKSPLKWWDLNTGKTTQLYEFTLPSITPKVTEQSGGGTERVMVAISPPVWQMDVYTGILPTGGFAFVNEKDYRLNVTNTAGTVERVIERPIAPKKGTDKDKEMVMERRREAQRNNTSGGIRITNVDGRQSFSTGGARGANETATLEEMMRNATFEEFIPVLRGMRTDPQGRIWLARTPADFGLTGPVDIIRADGTYIGTLTNDVLPNAVSKSGRAAYLVRDDMGVERVAVRRLPATWQ